MRKILKKTCSILVVATLMLGTISPAYADDTTKYSITNYNTQKGRSNESLNGSTGIYQRYLTQETVQGSTTRIIGFDKDDIASISVTSNNQTIELTDPVVEAMTFERPVWLYLANWSIASNTTVTQTLNTPIILKKDMMIRANTVHVDSAAVLNLNKPITVQNGATLLLDGMDNASVTGTSVTFINNTDDSAVIVEKGGALRVGAANLQDKQGSDTVVPFIQSNGGTVLLEGNPTMTGNKLNFDPSKEKLPSSNTYHPQQQNQTKAEAATSSSLVKATGDSVIKINEGNYSLTGSQPLVEFTGDATGGKIVLTGGRISAVQGAAIEVPAGMTVEIPADSKANITTSNKNAVAIDLADGAIFEKGNLSITVGTNGSDDNTDDNYVDNFGNVILAAGAHKAGSSMNAAVVLPDGTIVQGSEQDPPKVHTVNGLTSVEVPKGGSVTDKDGKTTPMPNGGSVESDGDDTEIKPADTPVTGITLNKDAITLYSNTTPNEKQLTATVEPENATDQTVDWKSSNGNVATVDQTGLVTAVGNGTATITAEAGGKTATCTVTVQTYTSPSRPSYSIVVDESDHGTVVAKPKHAEKGDTVTLTVTPDEGYALDGLTVTDKNGDVMTLTDKGDGKYTFKMPASKVTVEATFEKIDVPEPALPFTDVAKNAWYYPAIEYVYNNDLMNGTSATTFAPNVNLSRAMMAAVLYNMEGNPAVDANGRFSDVADGKWYTDAINWAAENDIVSGLPDGTYAPDQALTREQMASVLYRYAEYKGIDVSARADLSTFSDGDTVSPWAQDVVQWAVAEKLMNGNGNALQPKGTASRAQVATVLMNYCENVAK